MRGNPTVIAGGLDAADPQRLATMRENVNGLIRHMEDYPPEP